MTLPWTLLQVTGLLEVSNLKLFYLLAAFIESPFQCSWLYGMASPFKKLGISVSEKCYSACGWYRQEISGHSLIQ